MGKRKLNRQQNDDDEENEHEFNLPSKHMSTSHIRAQEKRLIIILEKAHLETVKVNKK